jgi:hypothetical protein
MPGRFTEAMKILAPRQIGTNVIKPARGTWRETGAIG